MQWMTMTSFVPCHALHAPQHAAASPFGPLNHSNDFFRPNCRSRHSALLEKYSVSLKTLLQQGISESEFYGDLVYRFSKIVDKSNFSEQFRKLINRCKRIGYSLDIMRQTACLVVNPIIVDGYASLFNCTTAVRASDSMMVSSLNFNRWVGV